MDAISYSYADKAQKRIKKFIENPDSTSGVVTVPTTIAAGETITIPAGRTAVLPNVQIDGTLNVEGTVFIPSGSTLSTVVEKVTSTDNAIVRFNGTTGDVQNSGVIIDDSGVLGLGLTPYTSNALLNLKGTGLALKNDKSGNNNNWSYITNEATGNESALKLSSGTGSLILDHLGNVGIGVTPSAWSSLVKAIDINTGGAIVATSTNTEVHSNSYYNAPSTLYKNNGYACKYAVNDGAGVHRWFTAPSGTAGNAITWTNAMTLHANGDLVVKGGYSGIVSYAGESTNSYVQSVGRATVTGNVCLDVFVGGVRKGAIMDNGNFQSSSNVYGSTSDIKLKENVVDTTPKLDKLMQVQVRNFNYIGQEDKQIGVIAQEIEQIFPSVVFETKDTKQIEVTKQRVIPAVEEVKDEEGNVVQGAVAESVETYIETETVETGEVTKNVKYSIIYMMMLKGMQEMRAEYTSEIAALKQEIEILKGAK